MLLLLRLSDSRLRDGVNDCQPLRFDSLPLVEDCGPRFVDSAWPIERCVLSERGLLLLGGVNDREPPLVA